MSVGMILLALWLILQGLPLIVRFVIPNKVMGILALLAGILILIPIVALFNQRIMFQHGHKEPG